MTKRFRLITILAAGIFILAACQSVTKAESPLVNSTDNTEPITNETATRNYDDLDIITLLPPDAIPAIDNPQFLNAQDAESEYAPDELILGVAHNGEAKAYSTGLLSSHEIVNDTIGGAKIAVTW
jgi:hypothetical protein